MIEAEEEKKRERTTELKAQSELQNATGIWRGITSLANCRGESGEGWGGGGDNHNAIVMQREWLDFQRGISLRDGPPSLQLAIIGGYA